MSRTLLSCALVFAGCGASVYPYLATNGDCSCELFRVADERSGVVYSFSATYSLSDVMNTRITVSMQNNSTDTLDLSLAYVRISSRNFPYRYNDKFLPVTVPGVPPGTSRMLTLDGEVDMSDRPDPWTAIAGEELVITLEGMRVNGKQAVTQIVRFVPRNPKLSS